MATGTKLCEICGKKVKNLKLHQRRAHSEASSEASPEAQPDLGQFGITPNQVEPFIGPIVVKAVEKTLGDMNIPAIINKAVNKKVDDLISQHQQQQSSVKPSSPSDNTQKQQDVPSWAQPILTGLGQRLVGSDMDLGKMANIMKMVYDVAELANAPYRQGRLHTLQETNEMIKLMKGVGGKPEDISTAVKTMTKAEIDGLREEAK